MSEEILADRKVKVGVVRDEFAKLVIVFSPDVLEQELCLGKALH